MSRSRLLLAVLCLAAAPPGAPAPDARPANTVEALAQLLDVDRVLCEAPATWPDGAVEIHVPGAPPRPATLRGGRLSFRVDTPSGVGTLTVPGVGRARVHWQPGDRGATCAPLAEVTDLRALHLRLRDPRGAPLPGVTLDACGAVAETDTDGWAWAAVPAGPCPIVAVLPGARVDVTQLQVHEGEDTVLEHGLSTAAFSFLVAAGLKRR